MKSIAGWDLEFVPRSLLSCMFFNVDESHVGTYSSAVVAVFFHWSSWCEPYFIMWPTWNRNPHHLGLWNPVMGTGCTGGWDTINEMVTGLKWQMGGNDPNAWTRGSWSCRNEHHHAQTNLECQKHLWGIEILVYDGSVSYYSKFLLSWRRN